MNSPARSPRRATRRCWNAHSSRTRRGLAVAETAILLPLLMLLMFGAIELANAVFLKQTLTVAAYEGGRAVSRGGATQAHGEARVAEIMSHRNIDEYQVQFSPEVTMSTPRGTTLEITVTAPASVNRVTPLKYLAGEEISITYCVVRL